MTENLPAKRYDPTDMIAMPIGMRVVFDDNLNERIKSVAGIMSRAEGMTPPHLVNKSEACYAVVVRALTWRLDPFSVAACTYMTPGGKVGYEGKLIQAALENSGEVEGRVKFEHYGDWSKVKGRIKKGKSSNGKDVWQRDWEDKDEEGLGVIVSAQVRGEAEPRTERFDLKSFQPRNSTLWAMRPEQQICYAAVRAFANLACPGILMGVPFEGDFGADRMVDITPEDDRPTDPKDRAYRRGWDDYAAGIGYRNAPRDLTGELHEAWIKGWQAHLAEEHGGPDEDEDKKEEEADESVTDDEAAEDPQPEAVKETKPAGDGQLPLGDARPKQEKPAAAEKKAPAKKAAETKPGADRAEDAPADGEGVESAGDPEQLAQQMIDDFLGATDLDALNEFYVQYEERLQALPEELYPKVADAYSAQNQKLGG